jgi:WS/DGAT/MGAT family acyltransferase
VFTVVGLAVTRLLLTPRQAVAAVRYGVAVVSTTLRILAFSRDPRTRFRGRLGVRKGAAWTRPHSLRAVKDIAAALGVTVNDVLLAATAGALRRYLLAYGDRAHDLRVFVPVNLRPLDQPVSADLGNRFGLVFLRLPVAEPDPVARVRAVHERMRPVKASYEAAATFAILSILGALPAWAHMLAVRILGSKSTAIVTNVPGPRQQVFLAGSPLDGVVFWVPQAGSVSLGVSIFSYSDTVTVGVAADSGLVADPQMLADAVEAELAELRGLTNPSR